MSVTASVLARRVPRFSASSALALFAATLLAVAATVAADTTKTTATSEATSGMPMMHVPIPAFWAALAVAFFFGMAFALVFTLCWRRQMSVEKFDSEFEGTPMMGTRSSFQKDQPYQSRRMCSACPWFLWMRI